MHKQGVYQRCWPLSTSLPASYGQYRFTWYRARQWKFQSPPAKQCHVQHSTARACNMFITQRDVMTGAQHAPVAPLRSGPCLQAAAAAAAATQSPPLGRPALTEGENVSAGCCQLNSNTQMDSTNACCCRMQPKRSSTCAPTVSQAAQHSIGMQGTLNVA